LENKIHFHNLDILRFVCAAALAIAHSYEAYFHWIGEPDFIQKLPQLKPILEVLISNFALGVPMFFLISGFLITYLLLVEKNKQGTIDVGKFIIRRSLRIWPLYYLAIIMGIILVKLAHRDMPDILSTVFFINNFSTIKHQVWQFPFAHFWSLSIEEHFYLVWPLLVYLIPIKRLPWCIGILIIGAIVFRYYIPHLYEEQQIQYALYLHTLSRIDDILVGALLAWWHFKKPFQPSLSTSIRMMVYTLFILGLFISASSNFWEWGIYSVLFKKYIYLAVMGFWLINYLFNPKAFANFKHKNVFHYLGKISFGIYVYHNMIIDVYISKFVKKLAIHNMMLYFICYFAFLFIISALSYELYEKYFLKLKNKFALIKTER
jgi:peptidoglycan/LPS O-acetylase OafA/YrhL